MSNFILVVMSKRTEKKPFPGIRDRGENKNSVWTQKEVQGESKDSHDYRMSTVKKTVIFSQFRVTSTAYFSRRYIYADCSKKKS